jgi:hypothetical protein
MEKIKRTFIITSVIHFSQKKLSYSNIRSVYNPHERAVQTLKTISSIREKVPGATIVLVEMGNNKKDSESISNAVDKYVFVGQHWLVKWACSSKHKGLGEAIGLLVAAKSLITGADMYFKISGRYFLNDAFDISLWNGTNFFFRKYKTGNSTRLYGFHADLFKIWETAMRKSLYQLYKGRSIENELPLHIDNKFIKQITPLGVAGFVAPAGEYLAE